MVGINSLGNRRARAVWPIVAPLLVASWAVACRSVAAQGPQAGDSAPKVEAAPPKAQASADKSAGSRPAHLIRVACPIDSAAESRVRAAVTRLMSKNTAGAAERPVIVFEFSPGQSDGGRGTEFGHAFELARFIASDPALNGVKTVAYIPRTIKGHAVLVALACEEIIMAPDADLGAAGIDETVIGPAIAGAYKEIAEAHKTVPTPLVLGMLDKELQVLRVTTEVGADYVLAGKDFEELKKRRAVKSVDEISPRPGLYKGLRGRTELGFVSYLAKDRQEVAQALELPSSALRDDPTLSGTMRPIQVPIRGVITKSLSDQTQRKIQDQIDGGGVNFVCVWIDSAGGSHEDCASLAGYLASLDSKQVLTVAYVPARAQGDAALVATACDQLVVGPDAVLGGSGAFELDPGAIDLVRRMTIDSLKKKGVYWSLPVALIDPTLKVFSYSRKGNGMAEALSQEEVDTFDDPKAWIQGEPITANSGPLRLSGDRAVALRLATSAVNDFSEFKRAYNLQDDVTMVEPGWADYLINAMSSPGILGFLLFLGLAGIISELYAPGHGIGGFISVVSFMLYFWIEYLHGTAGWLQVLLFLAGMGCLLLEIFVLPGFAIFGLGGGLMIIFSLVLASQTFIIPRNDYQLEQLKNTAVMICGAVIAAGVASVLFRRFLPRAPGLNRIFLHPMSGAEREQISNRESLVDFSDLVGQTGTATTLLMPSGKARFDGRLVDVIARGEVIDRGAEVVVVEVRGNHILVQGVQAE